MALKPTVHDGRQQWKLGCASWSDQILAGLRSWYYNSLRPTRATTLHLHVDELGSSIATSDREAAISAGAAMREEYHWRVEYSDNK